MKALMIMAVLVISAGCATTSKYQAKIQSWEGADSASLVRVWGQPNAIEPLHTGNKMMVYSRPKHTPLAYNGTVRQLAANSAPRPELASPLECATYFEVNPSGKIVSTFFRGSQCKSRD